MREVAELIVRVLENLTDENVISSVRNRVGILTKRFPLYAWKLQGAELATGKTG